MSNHKGDSQDPAIPLLTLFRTIKLAQPGPPRLTPSQEEGLAWEGNKPEGQDNRLLRCAPRGGM